MVEYTKVSRKTTNEDRIAICPQLGCETIKRVKSLKLGFFGFGKYPKCKQHHLPLVYVDERIGEIIDAALACLFDKAGLPPKVLLRQIKEKFPQELNTFINSWVYCITIGRGASIISSYMDSLSKSYLKQITKKQLKVLKDDTSIKSGRKKGKVFETIKRGIDEITLQYTRLLKHLRAYSEVLVNTQEILVLSTALRNVLIAWLEVTSKEETELLKIEVKQNIPLSQVKDYYDRILNLDTCRCLLGPSSIEKNNKKRSISAFDRFSAYLEFGKENLTKKFTKSDIVFLKFNNQKDLQYVMNIKKKQIKSGNYFPNLYKIAENLLDIELQTLFKKYNKQTEKYPNWGEKIQKKFINWISYLEIQNEKKKSFIQKCEYINNFNEINNFLIDKIKNTHLSMRAIVRAAEKIGLNITRYTIKKIALSKVFNNDTKALNERFGGKFLISSLTQKEKEFFKKKEFFEKDYESLIDFRMREIFKRYFKETNKYPNETGTILDEFKDWIKTIEDISNEDRNIFIKECDIINQDFEILKFVLDKALHTHLSLKKISEQLKEMGIKLSPQTIGRSVLNLIFNNNIEAFRNRFPIQQRLIPANKTKFLKNKVFPPKDYPNLNDKEIQLKFIEYNDCTNEYPNEAGIITDEFTQWIKNNKQIPNERKEDLLRKCQVIENNFEIYKFIANKIMSTNLSQIDIAKKLEEIGINIGNSTIGKYALELLYDNNINLYRERFPYNEPVPEQIKEEIIKDISDSDEKLTDIAEKHSVSTSTVTNLALENVFNNNFILYQERFPFDIHAMAGLITHKCINLFITNFFNKIYEEKYYSEPEIYYDSRKRPDGLVMNDKKFLQKHIKSKDFISSFLIQDLNIDFKDIDNIEAIIFDYTADLSDENIINKSKKYQHPNVLLFIVGTITDDFKGSKLFPEEESIHYPKNIRVISFKTFLDLVGVPISERGSIIKVINSNRAYNIDLLQKIYEQYNRKINLHKNHELIKDYSDFILEKIIEE